MFSLFSSSSFLYPICISLFLFYWQNLRSLKSIYKHIFITTVTQKLFTFALFAWNRRATCPSTSQSRACIFNHLNACKLVIRFCINIKGFIFLLEKSVKWDLGGNFGTSNLYVFKWLIKKQQPTYFLYNTSSNAAFQSHHPYPLFYKISIRLDKLLIQEIKMGEIK